ncbi:MAG: 2-dehydro-3-deoxy-6-phosphogalactonate aldolase [Betaproteobacteria bacterium]|nr:2-dehydro-3-deoxy-6-phosphogalactonate aldolase [Betaproteobacteria bacterium]
MKTAPDFRDALSTLPLVAILRGIEPSQALPIGHVLREAGWRVLEIPLNSPQPLQSIAALRARLPQCLIGAGTVMNAQQVRDVHAAGGQIIVSPHFDPMVVAQAKQLGMLALPGVATPSEAFAALRAQADGLKVFPAEMISPVVLKAWRAVLPPDILIFPVGGIKPDNMGAYRQAGASGFGIGSALFKPGMSVSDVQLHANHFYQAWTASS